MISFIKLNTMSGIVIIWVSHAYFSEYPHLVLKLESLVKGMLIWTTGCFTTLDTQNLAKSQALYKHELDTCLILKAAWDWEKFLVSSVVKQPVVSSPSYETHVTQKLCTTEAWAFNKRSKTIKL